MDVDNVPIAGAVLILLALVVLRGRSAAPSVTDTLARHGLYAIVQHPLYDGVFCELAGAVLSSNCVQLSR
ncbi:MAG: hypothetical protein AB1345_12310 [Chloroflexota bacterium]